MHDDVLNKAELAASGQLADEVTGSKYDRPMQIINQLKKSFQQVTPTALIQAGDQWGHLLIKQPIGQGGMGVVYEAHDTLLNRPVAVKFLNAQNSNIITTKEFIAEARHIAKIRHPHVMAVYGANTFKQITGFWSELLTGTTIDHMSLDELVWPNILLMASQLADAVKAIHDQGLIHGDIKPQNVILEPDKGVVLMDFGSVHDEAAEHPVWQSSTPLIMSPELFDHPQKSVSSDVYALGVVFYYLSHQKRFPHYADDLVSLQDKVKQAIEFKSTTGPKKWVKLLQQMLHQNPQRRPTMSQIIGHLRQIREAPAKRKKRLLQGALLAALLVFTVYLQFSNQRLSEANQRTQLALSESNQLNQLLQDMLASVSNINHGKDLLMIDAIKQFLYGIHASQSISDNIKAQALTTLANSQVSLGQYDAGMATLEAAKNLPSLSPLFELQININKAKFLLQDVHLNQDKIGQAKELLKSINQSPLLSAVQLTVLADMHHANMLVAKAENRFDDALQEGQAALKLWQLEPSNKTQWLHLGVLYDIIGQIHGIQGDYKAAELTYLKSLDHFQKVNSQPNSNTMAVRNNLAINYAQSGSMDQAQEQMTTLVEETRVFFGESHPRYFAQIGNLAATLSDNNQAEESLKLLEHHLPDLIESLGENSLYHIHFEGLIANRMKALNQFEVAERKYLRLIQSIANKLGNQHQLWYLNQTNLSELYIETGRPAEALVRLESLLPEVTKVFGVNSDIAQYMQKLIEQAKAAL